MDHVVYLDHKAKELDSLRNGVKSVVIRGAMGRKIPYGKVEVGDKLFFIENKGDGLIKASAFVSDMVNSGQLTKEESLEFLENNQDKLQLDNIFSLPPYHAMDFLGKMETEIREIASNKMEKPSQGDGPGNTASINK